MAPRKQGNNQAAAPQHANQPSPAGNAGGRGAPVSPLEDLMRRKGVDEAWDALEEMQRTGLPTDRFTISRMLMKTLADARRYWDPTKIHRSVALVERFVRQQPEEADEVLFNALLDTHCRMKDIAGLEATFSTMRELNIEPSHVTLGILVKAYGQACDIKSVLRLWDEMVEQRQQANAVTYGCMINACVRCGQTEKAVEIFSEMKKLKKHCNTILYTTLIKGYGNEKDLQSALGLFREMKEENVPYNTIAYNSIIDVCIKCSDVQAAEDIFREMLLPHSNVQPDLITYSTLLKGYCQVGNLDKALQVAETIKACGLKCDELVYNTLMDGCVKANDLSAGVGLFAEMMQSGMKPSSITHSIFLRLYQRNGYKGNASDAVAQLYQHHGLERPQSLEKPSRGRGSKGKSGGQKGLQGGSSGGAGGYDRPAQQAMPMPHPGQGPLPPGYLPQAGVPGMQPRDGMLAQAPPGRWHQAPSPSALLDGLGASVGGQVPCGPPPPQPPPCMGRAPGGVSESPYGILSSPSTYGGLSMDRSQHPHYYAPPPPRGPMLETAPPMHPYGAVPAPMSPYQQQAGRLRVQPGSVDPALPLAALLPANGLELVFWEIGGREDREAPRGQRIDALLVCYDVSDRASFQRAAHILCLHRMDKHRERSRTESCVRRHGAADKRLAAVLCGTKADDGVAGTVGAEEVAAFVEANRMQASVLTSALSGAGLPELVHALAVAVLEADQEHQAEASLTRTLEQKPAAQSWTLPASPSSMTSPRGIRPFEPPRGVPPAGGGAPALVEILGDGPAAPRTLARCLELGLLHRGVHVWLSVPRTGALLLRRWAPDAAKHPGQWGPTCHGEPRCYGAGGDGHAAELSAQAAERLVRDQLGVDPAQLGELEHWFSCQSRDGNCRELVDVYVACLEGGGLPPLYLSPKEEVDWVYFAEAMSEKVTEVGTMFHMEAEYRSSMLRRMRAGIVREDVLHTFGEAYMTSTMPGPYGTPPMPQDQYEAPFPSLLLQQRQQEEFMDRGYTDARRAAMGAPHGTGRKPITNDGY